MFRNISRGREFPHEHHHPRASGAASLHEAKLAAWAIAIGEHRPSADPPYRLRRHHRGMLDDLPSPERPYRRPRPSFRAIMEMVGLAFRRIGRPVAVHAGSLTGASKTPVGESAAVTYIERSEARESSEPAPARAAADTLQFRAA